MKKNNTFCKLFVFGVTFLGLALAGPSSVEGETAPPAGCPVCDCPPETVTTFHDEDIITPRMMGDDAGSTQSGVKEKDGTVTISIPAGLYFGRGLLGMDDFSSYKVGSKNRGKRSLRSPYSPYAYKYKSYKPYYPYYPPKVYHVDEAEYESRDTPYWHDLGLDDEHLDPYESAFFGWVNDFNRYGYARKYSGFEKKHHPVKHHPVNHHPVKQTHSAY